VRVVPLLLGALMAQDPGTRATFSSRADLVVLHVAVVDRHAGFVAGLPKDAFVVRENGRVQPIAMFQQDDSPVTVGLVIDNSGSMVPRRDAVIAAGMAFAASSNPADEMFTVNFNERIWHGLPPGQPFTSDHAVLRQALGRATARGRTALFDALLTALRQLDEGSLPRKVLILVSDGGDNASRASFADVLDAALRRDVVIYTICLADPNDREAKPRLLRELAKVTGGESFEPRSNGEITPILERIARDVRSSYTIAYAPPAGPAPGARRQIDVDVQGREYRGYGVRARSLYIPPESGGGH
jgi:Ca-activated chloride channel family protein